MKDPFYRAILSNKLEILFEGLKERLFQSQDPFRKVVCLVPSAAMKNWITHRLVEDPENGICMGFVMKPFNEGVTRLAGKRINFPHPLELSLKIEKELKADFQKNRLMKAYELAQEFALFREYSERAPTFDWQKKIWEAVFPNEDSFFEELSRLDFAIDSLPDEVHIFCMNYLTPAKHRFFIRLSQYTSVYAWILTPSRMYWEGRRRGVLEEEHPLLVTNGKIGREWFSLVDYQHIQLEEVFAVAEGISHEMEDGIVSYPVVQTNLLHAIQADLCFLSRPDKTVEFEKDDSIQIHVAPTIVREVELTFHMIKNLLSEETQLQPKDILVLVPSLDTYLPYFKAYKSEIPLEVGDVVETIKIPFMESWILFLELPEKRFSFEAIFLLLEKGKIRSKIDFEELMELKKAFETYKVEWGFDLEQREAYIGQPLEDKSSKGTWVDGLDKLMASLAIYSSEKEFLGFQVEGFYPHKLSLTQVESLNLFMEWIENLKIFFKDLNSKSLLEWTLFLEKSLEELECQTLEDKNIKEVILKSLYQLSRWDVDSSLCYQDLLFLVKKRFEEDAFSIREQNLNSIKVHTLLPMRAVCSKVIIVMGLNPEEFPSQVEFKCSDEMLRKIVPTKRDFDRYLFLETLLSARNKWILTYTSSVSQGHSTVVEDLLRYLDQYYRIEGKTPSEKLVFNHPTVAFDPIKYHPKFATFSDYCYFKQLTDQEEKKAQVIFKPPLSRGQFIKSIPASISLKELRMAFLHPLRFYMNKALGIFLKKPKAFSNLFDSFEENDQLSFDFNQMAHADFDRLIDLLEFKGYLPKKPFLAVSKERLRAQYEAYQKMLAKLNLKPADLFSVEFISGLNHATQKNSREWFLPAPKIEFQEQKIEIVGKINSMSPLGLITLQKKERKNSIRLISEILIQEYIPEEIASKQVCYIKNGISEKPITHEWEYVLENYLRLHEQPTPFLPAWVDPILEGSQENLKVAMEKSLQPSFFDESIDPYLKWASFSLEDETLDQIICDWQEIAKRLFK